MGWNFGSEVNVQMWYPCTKQLGLYSIEEQRKTNGNRDDLLKAYLFNNLDYFKSISCYYYRQFISQ